MKKSLMVFSLLIPSLIQSQTDVDTIYMKDGSKYAVSIKKQDKSTIQFERSGQKGKINMDQVDRIFSCNISLNKVDDFTGEKIAKTGEVSIGKTKMGMHIRSSVAFVDDRYFFYITAYLDLGCIGSDDKVMVKFEDDEVLTFHHIGKIECGTTSFSCIFVDGDLDQYDNNNFVKDVEERNLEKFKTTPISKIRLDGSDSYHDFDVTDKYFMMNALSCLEKVF
jgi:hypothetical protein